MTNAEEGYIQAQIRRLQADAERHRAIADELYALAHKLSKSIQK